MVTSLQHGDPCRVAERACLGRGRECLEVLALCPGPPALPTSRGLEVDPWRGSVTVEEMGSARMRAREV